MRLREALIVGYRRAFEKPRIIKKVRKEVLDQGDYYDLGEASKNGRLSPGDIVDIKYRIGEARGEKKGVFFVGGPVQIFEGGYYFLSPDEGNPQKFLLAHNLISWEKTADATKKSAKAAEKAKASLKPALLKS